MDTFEPVVEVCSHVIEVEFHVYMYHIFEKAGYKLHTVRNPQRDDYSQLACETVDLTLIKQNGDIITRKDTIPEVYTNCLDFYVLDLPQPSFFPSYWCHTLSPNGVVLKQVVFQSLDYRTKLPFTMIVPDFMLSIELDEVRAVEWRTGRGREFRVDFISIPDFIQRQRLYTPLAANNTAEKINERSRAQPIITDKIVDLRPICPRIFNQGDLGTCGVTNFTSLIEWVTGKKLSVLYLYWNTRVRVDQQLHYDDSGSEYDSMMKAVYDYGLCADELWPYNSVKFMEEPPKEAYDEAEKWMKFKPEQFHALSSLEEIKQSLRQKRPVLADIMFGGEAYCKGVTRSGQVPNMPHDSVVVDSNEHSCLIVGYNDETAQLIIQNSWGTGWGLGGFGYVPYEYILTKHFTHLTTWTPDQ